MPGPENANGDGFPVPGDYVTDGTKRKHGPTKHSAIDPRSAEYRLLEDPEFRKDMPLSMIDVFTCTSATTGEKRYIRKLFVESLSPHPKGTIVRTFSGDFHVVTESLVYFSRHIHHEGVSPLANTVDMLNGIANDLRKEVERLKRRTQALEMELRAWECNASTGGV